MTQEPSDDAAGLARLQCGAVLLTWQGLELIQLPNKGPLDR